MNGYQVLMMALMVVALAMLIANYLIVRQEVAECQRVWAEYNETGMPCSIAKWVCKLGIE